MPGILVTARRLAVAGRLAAGGAAGAVLALTIAACPPAAQGPVLRHAMLGLNGSCARSCRTSSGPDGRRNGLSLPTLHATLPIYYSMRAPRAVVIAVTYLVITSRSGCG